jgi:hypothetical protein
MTPKTRAAVALLVEHGLTQREAASRAGMDERSLSRALKRKAIADYVEHQKALLISRNDAIRAHGEAIALRVALDLMQTAQSEAIRMRAVEFFARKPEPGASVTVQTHIHAGTYAYPSLRDVTPHDGASQALDHDESSQQGPSGKR